MMIVESMFLVSARRKIIEITLKAGDTWEQEWHMAISSSFTHDFYTCDFFFSLSILNSSLAVDRYSPAA